MHEADEGQQNNPKISKNKVYEGSITKSENSEKGQRLSIKFDKPVHLHYNGDVYNFTGFSAYGKGLRELKAELDLQTGRIKIPRKALETIVGKLNRDGRLIKSLAYQKMQQRPEEQAYMFIEEAESKYPRTVEDS